MKKIILTGLTAAVLSANAMASEVTGYTAPQSGQAATAAGVDANFQSLITAINDNNQRIAALEAASGEVTDLNAIVSGATYQVFFSGGYINNSSDSQSTFRSSQLERFGGNTLITFHANNTLSETFNEVGRFIDLEREHNCDQFNNCEHYSETWEDVDQTSGPGGSWSVSGQTLTVLWPGDAPGDEEEFLLSANGSILILGGGGRNVETDQFGTQDQVETFLAVGTKLSAQ